MNRKERRKAAAISIKQVLVTPELAQQMLSLGCMCCWMGCKMNYQGPMPDGWRSLLMFWSSHPISKITDIPERTWDRDGVLCPEHAQALEGLLKDLGYGLAQAEPRGEA